MDNIPMNPSRLPRSTAHFSPEEPAISVNSSASAALPVRPALNSIPSPETSSVLPAMTNETVRAPAQKTPSDSTGELPEYGMLANAYVPFQRPGQQYSQQEGLKKGTLFPGLDLPFKNYIATRDVANTPMGELMAMGFAIGELGLYLDTHPGDKEALELRNSYVKMYWEAHKSYEQQYGPLSQATVMDGKFTWLNSPWPWEVK